MITIQIFSPKTVKFLRELFNKIDASFYVPILLGIIYILPLVALAFSNHPIADDFCNSLNVRDNGYLRYVSSLFDSWSGRYTSNAWIGLVFLISMIGKSGFFFVYKIGPIMLILSLFLTTMFLLYGIGGKLLTMRQKISMSALFLVLNLFFLPSINESIYWMTSSLIYQFGNILVVLFFTFIILFFKSQRPKQTILTFVTLIGLELIIIGFHELIMVGLLTFISVNLAICFIRDERKKWFIAILFVVALIATYFEISAHGNYVRMGYYPQSKNLFYSISASFLNSISFLLDIMKQSVFWFISLVIAILGQNLSRAEVFKKISNPAIYILVTFSIVFVMFFPTFWATGGLPPLRATQTIQFVFFVGWIAFIFSMISYLSRSKFLENSQLKSKAKLVIFAVCVVIFSLSLVAGSNFRIASGDILDGSAIEFNNELNDREAQIYESLQRKQLNVVFKPLPAHPKTLFNGDVDPDPTGWVNLCYAKFYGLRSVSVEK